MVILTVKPDYLPKSAESYASIEVVWSYNENEVVVNREVDKGELSEITEDDEDEGEDGVGGGAGGLAGQNGGASGKMDLEGDGGNEEVREDEQFI